MTSPSAVSFEVALDTFEAIVSGGVQRVTWQVLCDKEEDWVPAATYAAAHVEDLDRTPRVVWRQRIHIPLPSGAELRRLESRPVPRTSRDPLSYLVGTRNNSKVRTVRVEFEVGAKGDLIRKPRPAKS